MTINWHEFFEYDGFNLIRKPIGNKKFDNQHAGKIVGSKRPTKNGGVVHLRVQLFEKRYYVHRIIWEMNYGEIPEGYFIDHIDGDGLNNRLSNLRLVTLSKNQRNRPLNSNNKSGLHGVYWIDSRKRWLVQINCDGVLKSIGHEEDFFEAACKRKSAELEWDYHLNHGRKAQ